MEFHHCLIFMMLEINAKYMLLSELDFKYKTYIFNFLNVK